MGTPETIAAELQASISGALPLLEGADEHRTARRPGPGRWCAREVLGHLIDSASTNHRRFVLAQAGDLVRYDGYDQNVWVERQRYHEAAWHDLVALWTAYNRHLAYVMAGVPRAALAYAATPPDGGEPVTLGFVMEYYVRHLRHHLAQLQGLLAS